ncbi:hypothetical protein PHLCEN_2v4816 [Hermanssonia centrifuga]|uniref:Uncharacterized protein n=1 Tax=Hermanssonia centrifuga TaxID=98765 RepID=A0A2R6PG80_9APHY|nr:hypothetical protein PHLCEN_2v4816 [Hermanssonia centrifuga]
MEQIVTSRGLVPQRKYGTNAMFTPPPKLDIEFCVKKVKGIRVSDVLLGNVGGLDEPDAKVFNDQVGQKVSYRLEMLGYESFSVQRNARSRPMGSPVSHARQKVVTQVAEIIQKFINDNMNRQIDGEHLQWRVGGGMVNADRLFITGLMRVSPGSFQPVLEVSYLF